LEKIGIEIRMGSINLLSMKQENNMGSERHLLDHELQQFVERWHIVNGSELESIAKKFEDKANELRCNQIKTIKISDGNIKRDRARTANTA